MFVTTSTSIITPLRANVQEQSEVADSQNLQ
jgi:hypothetical protein